jgi:hypothetical protein
MAKAVTQPILLFLFSLKAHALALNDLDMNDLKNGDVILQSQACFVCQLIEEEENSPYSHIGVIVTPEWGEPMVLESWGYVTNTPLSEFIARRKRNTRSMILRPRSQFKLASIQTNELLNRFVNYFAGKTYDPEFLWNNRDENGELLYCSEFVAKFINPLLGNKILPKAMHYERNRSAWMHYFKGTPPDGKPGISPGDFERSPLFHQIGLL